MIKIEHDNIQDAADKFASVLSVSFNERLASIQSVIGVILKGGVFSDTSFKNTHYKTLCSICSYLSIDSEIKHDIKKKKLLEILNKSETKIDRHHLTEVNTSLLVLSKLVSDTKLFNAPVIKLKGLNKKFKETTEIRNLPTKIYYYLFDYNHYKGILDQYISKELSIVCCPYCNRNYVTFLETESNGEKIFGPTYDHYFHKNEHKYLTISFFNLVPSCYICNSSLKGTIEFDLNYHLNPYDDGFSNHAKFNFDPKADGKTGNIDFQPKLIPSKDIDPKMKMKIFGDGKKLLKNKVKGNVNVFKLNQVYQSHSDLVKEIYDTFDKHSKFEFLSIQSDLKNIGIPENEFYNYYFKNYFEEIDYHKRPLSKLSKEIYEVMKEFTDKRNKKI